MTRKLTRNYSLSAVAPFIAILTVLIAHAGLAQTTSAELRSARRTAGAMQQNTGVPGQRLEHPVVMRTPNAELTSAIPPLHFSKPIPYDPGGCCSIAVADVNGDGHLDLVVAYWNEGSVGVLLGKGDGTFQPVVKYNSGGTGALSVAVADLNGDGKPDIVVLNALQKEGTVGVLLGNSDGTFQPPVTYDTGQYSMPESLAVGDLNGDGHPDIVVANFGHSDCDCNDGRVGVLWGNGDGTFQPTVFYPSGGYDTVSVTIQDGLLLVINLCQDQYCNWPNGSVCVNGSCYDSGGVDPYSVAVGDLNGDGRPDIVVANLLSNPNNDPSETVGVLLNDGWGGFQSAVLYNPGGAYPYLGAVADLNGDGKPDIVVGTRSGTSVLLGNGDGTVQPPVIVGPLGGSLIAADLNGNGKPDLIGIGAVMLNTSGYATTTQIRSSLNPSFLNQPVTFTAAVTSRSRTIPDGELVTFYDGTTAIASVALAGGTAAYSTSTLSARTHSIKARYSGDAFLAPSTGSITQVVLKYPTTTSLTSSPNPSLYGQPVTLTATVTSAGPAPTGTVTFRNGSVILGSKTLNGSGVATLTTAKIPVGADTLTSTYNGDAFNAKSVSAAITQTVGQASISMVLTSYPNPSIFGRSVKFTATLTSNVGLPSGQPVTFSYNGATLGTANVNSKGVATFYTTALRRGSHAVTAAFTGTVDYSSASAAVKQLVK